MDKKLNSLLEYANNNSIPVILPESAKFLVSVAKKHNPKNILEIGTAIGYSGSLLLLNTNAKLTTIEKDFKMATLAMKNFENLKLTDRVSLLLGDTAEFLDNIKLKFDFIFLDGPKAQYIHYLQKLLKLLNIGGVLIADNIYFKGYVKSENYPKKHKTIVTNLREFISVITTDKNLDTELFDIGDGLSVTIKKANSRNLKRT